MHNLNFALALLNSKLYEYLYSYISQERNGRVFSQVKTVYIKQLPMPKLSLDEQQPLSDLANEILKLKKVDPNSDTAVFENKIDQIVYKLYGLTEDEIEIVEGI